MSNNEAKAEPVMLKTTTSPVCYGKYCFVFVVWIITFTTQLRQMMEILTSNEKGNDKLVALIDGVLYKTNPKTDQETDILANGLRNGSFDTTKVWDIKVNRCKEIRLQDGKPYIEIFWGRAGEEQLRITDEYKRYKFFEFIKSNTPDAMFTADKWSIWRAGRKPLIASLVVLVLFLWTLFYAIRAEQGYVYYVANGRYDSITGIVLAIASLGLVKVILIFSFLLGITAIAFVNKAKRRTIVRSLLING